jgi:DNA-binding PadR family transcriptional regulator
MTRHSPRLSPQTVGILEELLRQPASWRYGYELLKATGLAAGTLYPMLARLSEFGWLAAEWSAPTEPGRPPRHHYRLTPEGRVGARDMIARALAAGHPVRPRRA